MKYLDDNGGIKDDEFYIFTGDYIDRGVEKCGGCKFPDIYHGQEEIVLMLEGNHERMAVAVGKMTAPAGRRSLSL